MIGNRRTRQTTTTSQTNAAAGYTTARTGGYAGYDATHGILLALAAAIAGACLWLVSTQIGFATPGRFWASMGIMFAAGFIVIVQRVLGVAMKGELPRPAPATFLIGFLPALVCVGWTLIATQPIGADLRSNFWNASASIGVLQLVQALGGYDWLLAFGLGAALGLCLDGAPAVNRTVAAGPVQRTQTTTIDDGTGPERVATEDELRQAGISRGRNGRRRRITA